MKSHRSLNGLKFRTGDSIREFLRKFFGMATLGLAAIALGCGPAPEDLTDPGEQVEIAPNPMTMLVVGDEALGARIARQWSARRDGQLTIINQTETGFSSGDFEVPPEIDVVIYPPAMLVELVVRDQIMTMPDEIWTSDVFKRKEMLRHFRLSIIRYSDEPWAVPLGSPNFSMLCNRELFKRMQLAPPDSWAMVDQTLEKIAEQIAIEVDANPATLDAKVDMPLAIGWAAPTFLARVAPAIRHRGKLSTVFDRATMKPLITTPPFVEALEHLKSIMTARSLELRPADVYRLAVAGESHIGLAWPALGFSDSENGDSNERTEDEPDRLIIRPLPGMSRWFDQQTDSWIERDPEDDTRVDLIGVAGLIGSVASHCSDDRAAWEFLEWLSSKPISLVTLVDSPAVGPFRASQLGDVSHWTGDEITLEVADEFADVVAKNHARSLVFLFPRIPGSQRYLDALDASIRDFVSGNGSAQETLDRTADEWELITESLGRENQVRRLRKDSGS